MTLRITIQFALYGERGIELSKYISKSLQRQLFFTTFVSLTVAIIIFSISFFSGNALLDKTVYSYSFAKRMAEQQFAKLQNYVEKEEITLNNLQRLNAWCNRGEKVYLAIYNEYEIVYDSMLSANKYNQLNTDKFDPDMEDPNSEYTLTLYDGVNVRTFLYYYAGDAFYFWMTVVSGMFAFVAFLVCFVLFISKKITYITRLKAELNILAGGQLDYSVTVKGKDEIGELAQGIDQMRCSILRHQETENQMRNANSELITAMSHDLRTPLTSLLVYLEIIERKKYKDDHQMEELIHKSVAQTMRIKQMADKLFTYFLAYATEWETADMETVDADELFAQILGDYAYALESKGMNVETDFAQTSTQISINTELLQRAFDNLYSNLLKYADPQESIWISYKQKDENLLVTITNTIKADHAKSESTSIGLITCRRIIEYYKGTFSANEISGSFYVTLSLPLQK